MLSDILTFYLKWFFCIDLGLWGGTVGIEFKKNKAKC